MSYIFHEGDGRTQRVLTMQRHCTRRRLKSQCLSRSEHTLCHPLVLGSENEFVVGACPCEVRYGCVAERMGAWRNECLIRMSMSTVAVHFTWLRSP